MLRNIFEGLHVRKYDRNVQRFLLFGIFYFSGLALFLLLYNLYLLRLGYREDFIGRLASLTPLACGIVAVPIGIWSDRIGRKPFLIAAALLLGLSQLGLCLTLRPALLFCFAFLSGISLSFVYVIHVPFLAENSTPEMRGQAISVGFATQVLTRMLLSLVGGALPGLVGGMMAVSIDRPEPFRYVLLLGACITLLSVFPLLSIRPQADRASEPVSEPEGVAPWKLLATFLCVSAFRGLSFGMSVTFFNVFFEEELLASTATIGAIFTLSQAVGVPSAVAAPALSRRFGATVTIVLLRLLGAVCLGLLGGSQSLLLGVLVLLVFWAAESAATPMEMAFATELLPRPYWGRLQSLRVMGYQLTSAAGSFWAGEMIVRVGYGPTYGVGALAVLASGVVIMVRFGWRSRQ